MPAKHNGKRMFTAEAKMYGRTPDTMKTGMKAGKEAFTPSDDITNRELLEAIESLGRRLGAEPEAAPPPQEDAFAQLQVDGGTLMNDVALMRNELNALQRSIQETKAEIAALRPHDEDDDQLLRVTHELDAVVEATEGATETILEAAEQIDELANSIGLSAADETERQQTEEIQERIIKIFEACNFQDLTGQRITKIVNTLKFVDERIQSMIEIWGHDSFVGLEKALHDRVPEKVGDEDLLNGPQLADKGISQNDIDALFD
ncbi:MAG: protein phosphatase CheZ [Magnetospiraceae bacterium]